LERLLCLTTKYQLFGSGALPRLWLSARSSYSEDRILFPFSLLRGESREADSGGDLEEKRFETGRVEVRNRAGELKISTQLDLRLEKIPSDSRGLISSRRGEIRARRARLLLRGVNRKLGASVLTSPRFSEWE